MLALLIPLLILQVVMSIVDGYSKANGNRAPEDSKVSSKMWSTNSGGPRSAMTARTERALIGMAEKVMLGVWNSGVGWIGAAGIAGVAFRVLSFVFLMLGEKHAVCGVLRWTFNILDWLIILISICAGTPHAALFLYAFTLLLTALWVWFEQRNGGGMFPEDAQGPLKQLLHPQDDSSSGFGQPPTVQRRVVAERCQLFELSLAAASAAGLLYSDLGWGAVVCMLLVLVFSVVEVYVQALEKVHLPLICYVIASVLQIVAVMSFVDFVSSLPLIVVALTQAGSNMYHVYMMVKIFGLQKPWPTPETGGEPAYRSFRVVMNGVENNWMVVACAYKGLFVYPITAIVWAMALAAAIFRLAYVFCFVFALQPARSICWAVALLLAFVGIVLS